MNKKRIVTGLMGLGVAGILSFGAPTAHAACPGDGPTRTGDGSDTITPTATGELYGQQNAAGDGGVVGTEGSNGYIEAKGDTTSGAIIQGTTTGGEANGRAELNDAGASVCVNDNSVTAP